jgi:hypothetical protein
MHFANDSASAVRVCRLGRPPDEEDGEDELPHPATSNAIPATARTPMPRSRSLPVVPPIIPPSLPALEFACQAILSHGGTAARWAGTHNRGGPEPTDIRY